MSTIPGAGVVDGVVGVVGVVLVTNTVDRVPVETSAVAVRVVADVVLEVT